MKGTPFRCKQCDAVIAYRSNQDGAFFFGMGKGYGVREIQFVDDIHIITCSNGHQTKILKELQIKPNSL